MRRKRDSYGIEEARRALPTLVERARKGTITIVTRRGEPCAAIVPLAALPVEVVSDFMALRGSGRGLWGADPAAYVAAERDLW